MRVNRVKKEHGEREMSAQMGEKATTRISLVVALGAERKG
jgi:hypothetical protein